MKKLEDLTIKEVVNMCYNTKYCAECEIRDWCNSELEKPVTDWEVKGFTKMAIGAITAEEVPDDNRT